ncbi:MAG: CPBP family intramembrane metalloprotease [Vicinamibacteria bacterium]|nr:CPBP family intramembrane metalloprotease [Vicinamibacteria bacterium]
MAGSTRRDARREVGAFFALALLLSWGLWVPTIASQRGLIAAQVPVMPWGSFGPALAALIVATRLGEAGALLRGLKRWRARIADYAIALLGPLALVVVAAAADLAWKAEPLRLENLGNLWLAPLFFALILVVGGPLGEEIGWRGFALPRLLGPLGPLGASLALAAMWVVWHLPLFWLRGAAQEGGSVAWFAALVLASAILFTWFWQRTQGNLWLAVVLHTGINATTFGAPLLLPSLEHEAIFTPVFAALAALLALAAAASWRRTPDRT